VVGILNAEIDRPLRPPFASLVLLRLVKMMALECALKVVMSELPNRYKLSDNQDDVFESDSIKFYKNIFPSLLKTLLMNHISSVSKSLRYKTEDSKDVDISAVPSISSAYVGRILQTHRSVSTVREYIDPFPSIDSSTMKASAPKSDLLFHEVLQALESSSLLGASSDQLRKSSNISSPRPNEDNVVDNFKEISPTIANALSVSNNVIMFSCPDQADLARFIDTATAPSSQTGSSLTGDSKVMYTKSIEANGSSIDIDSTSNTSYTGSVQVRLKCFSGTTHCRIRSGPSLDSPEVGEVVNCSIVEVSGAVGDFYRLADGRGFVKVSIEHALSWERVDSQTVSKRTAQLSSEFIDQLLLSELDGMIGWGSYRFIAKLATAVLPYKTIFDFNGQTSHDISVIHLLLKMAGLGKLRQGRTKTNRKDQKQEVMKSTPLLSAVKRAIASATLDTNVLSEDNGNEGYLLSPLLLAIVKITSGLLLHKAMQAQLHENKGRDDTSQVLPVIKPVVLESAHEYENNTDQITHVSLPGAQGLEITFDEESSTEVLLLLLSLFYCTVFI
jgi:hypothetical protein